MPLGVRAQVNQSLVNARSGLLPDSRSTVRIQVEGDGQTSLPSARRLPLAVPNFVAWVRSIRFQR